MSLSGVTPGAYLLSALDLITHCHSIGDLLTQSETLLSIGQCSKFNLRLSHACLKSPKVFLFTKTFADLEKLIKISK